MDYIKNISIIFISIFFESFPFLLLGAFISSIIENYVTDEMIAKYDLSKIKNNTWYEIEGVLYQDKDKNHTDIIAVRVVNIKEIDGSKEEQYVYPCYAYDNGTCQEIQKYHLEY